MSVLTDRAYAGRRVTHQREAIATVAAAMPGAFTVDELVSAVRRAEPVAGATATVYRAVTAMEDSGFLERVGTREGSALYAPCDSSDHHHHHVVCDGCGRTEVAECPIDTAALSQAGFTITRHEVVLYGLCPTCAVNGD